MSNPIKFDKKSTNLLAAPIRGQRVWLLGRFILAADSTERRLLEIGSHVIMVPKGEMPMNPYVTGNTIKKLREAKKLTQADFANILAVSDKTISKWETGGSQT